MKNLKKLEGLMLASKEINISVVILILSCEVKLLTLILLNIYFNVTVQLYY